MGILKGIGIAIGSVMAVGAIATVVMPKPTPPARTEEQIQRDTVDLQLGAAVKALKSAAKDPDSFKLEQVLAMADGAGCISYHAKNSFGASVRGQAVAAAGKVLTADRDAAAFSRAHDAHCGGKSGRDITSYTKQFL